LRIPERGIREKGGKKVEKEGLPKSFIVKEAIPRAVRGDSRRGGKRKLLELLGAEGEMERETKGVWLLFRGKESARQR